MREREGERVRERGGEGVRDPERDTARAKPSKNRERRRETESVGETQKDREL